MANRTEIKIDVVANTKPALQSINELSQSFGRMGNNSATRNLTNDLNSIDKAIRNIQNRAAQPIRSQADFSALERSLINAESSTESLRQRIVDLQNMTDRERLEIVSPDTVRTIKDGQKAINTYSSALNNGFKNIESVRKALNDVTEAERQLTKAQETQTKAQQSQETALTRLQRYTQLYNELREAYSNYQKTLDSDKGDNHSTATEQAIETAKMRLNAAGGAMSSFMGGRTTLSVSNIDDTKLNNLEATLARYKDDVTTAENATQNAGNAATIASQNLDQMRQALSNAQTAAEQNSFQELVTALRQLHLDTSNIESLEDAKNLLANFESQKILEVNNALQAQSQHVDELTTHEAALRTQLEGVRQELDEINQRQNNTKSIATRIAALGSLTSMYRILRNVMKDAYNTVKELDAAMAETAVVTSYSINDMWSTLSDYTKRANELGVAIQDVYESSTLYYQQGLNTAKVNQLTTSTLKMARIAGLDAADATDRMTNALRGFNMELNETNAENVADVYSKLASITASNVDEISTAMTKVASLANSANMSFENTAAFLAQIIETTRESAETAGTALKTVVARFAEVKSNPGSSTEVEGEVASYNNIDKALKSVGISLKDFMNGTEGLDSVLLKLAKKWNSLSTATQRYIATQAAGSRQQSRFIALMSDYARTQELTTAANNAAGASTEQYGKTLESLETKLNQLQNAWDTFITGLTDQSIIKDVVTLLTSVINAINDLNTNVEKSAGDTAAFMLRLTEGIVLLGAFSVVLKGVAGAILALGKQQSILAGFLGGVTSSFSKLTKTIRETAAASLNQANNTRILGRTLTQTNAIGLTSIKILGVIALKLAAIAAVIATIYIAYKTIKANSLSGQIETASSYLSILSDAATDANTALDELQDTLNNFDTKLTEIGQLAQGTTEWAAAVAQLNTEVLDLAESYGVLGQVQYQNGIAYLPQETKNQINQQAIDNVIRTRITKNNQIKVTDKLEEQQLLNTKYKTVNDTISKADFTKLINALIDGNQVAAESITTDTEVQKAANDVAQEILNNKSAQEANTQAIYTLNNTLNNEEQRDYNEQYIAAKMEAAATKYVDEHYTETLQSVGQINAGGYVLFYADAVEKYLQTVWDNKDLQVTSGLGINGGLRYRQSEDDEWVTLTEDAIIGAIKSSLEAEFLTGTAGEKARAEAYNSQLQEESKIRSQISSNTLSTDAIENLVDKIVAETGTEEHSSLNLTRDEYKAGFTVFNADENYWKNFNAGWQASSTMSSIDTLFADTENGQAIADQVWSTLYEGFFAGGVAENFDFSQYSAIVLSKLAESLTADEAVRGAIDQALDKQKEANQEVNKNFSRANFASDDFTDESITGQEEFFERSAKALANFSGDLQEVNGEFKKGSELVAQYANQLKRVAVYGDDFANAITDYNTALTSGNITDQNKALSTIYTNLVKIADVDLSKEDFLSDEVQTLLPTATASVENFANLLDVVQKKAWANSTEISSELVSALTALGSGYTRIAGEIITNNEVITQFNALLEQDLIDLEKIKTLLGSSYTFDLKTTEDGKQIIQSLTAVGNKGLSDILTAGSTSSSSKWSNPLERHYELLKKITSQQSKLNVLQSKYELATKVASGYTEDINENLQEQIKLNQQALNNYQTLYNSYNQDLDQLNTKYAKYADYMHYNTTTGQLEVNESKWQAKDNKITSDSALAKTLDKMKEEFENAFEGQQDALDNLYSIKNDIAEMKQDSYDSYWDLVQDTIDLLVEQQQKQIDLEQESLDNEKDANNELLTTVKDNFTKLRQDRENEKTVKTISDLTKKIAYLRQDTTGANAVQIKGLEKELKEQTEDYTDTLIDQNIDATEKANEKAFEQRQEQIDLLQSQLDWDEKHGKFEDDARDLVQKMSQQMDSGVEVGNTEWGKLFKEINGSTTSGNLYSRLNEVKTDITAIKNYLPGLIDQTDSENNPTGATETNNTPGLEATVAAGTTDGTSIKGNSSGSGTNATVAALQTMLNVVFGKSLDPDGSYGPLTKQAMKEVQQSLGISTSGQYDAQTRTAIINYIDNLYAQHQSTSDPDRNAQWTAQNKYAKNHDLIPLNIYKTGGLADFTGPAWLDGTTSNPELVLNAKDTENFIQLKDILRGLFNQPTNNTSIGDSYFNIDVNVDQIASSYDIEQLAEDIKYSIYKDSMYRNVNLVSTAK